MMLWRGSKAYFNAACILFKHEQGKTPFPRPDAPAYFLVCQAIELVLKGFLRGSGKSEDSLVKEYGHNLMKALDAAEKHGLTTLLKIETEERSALKLVNAHYESKALQFTIEGVYDLPRFEVLLEIAEKLIAKTGAFCLKNRELHAGKPTAVIKLRSARKK